MLRHLNQILSEWEPLWLFGALFGEFLVSILIWRMARIEFDYDREWNERKAARRKKRIKEETIIEPPH